MHSGLSLFYLRKIPKGFPYEFCRYPATTDMRTRRLRRSPNEWRQAYLQSKADRLSRRERELDEEIKSSVADIIKETLKDFTAKFKEGFIRFFKGVHQENVISVIKEMHIDRDTADRLSQYGFHLMEDHTVGEILDRAETEDIRDALHNAGAGYRQIGHAEIEAVKNEMEKGVEMEQIVQSVAEQAAQKVVSRRHR